MVQTSRDMGSFWFLTIINNLTELKITISDYGPPLVFSWPPWSLCSLASGRFIARLVTIIASSLHLKNVLLASNSLTRLSRFSISELEIHSGALAVFRCYFLGLIDKMFTTNGNETSFITLLTLEQCKSSNRLPVPHHVFESCLEGVVEQDILMDKNGTPNHHRKDNSVHVVVETGLQKRPENFCRSGPTCPPGQILLLVRVAALPQTQACWERNIITGFGLSLGVLGMEVTRQDTSCKFHDLGKHFSSRSQGQMTSHSPLVAWPMGSCWWLSLSLKLSNTIVCHDWNLPRDDDLNMF